MGNNAANKSSVNHLFLTIAATVMAAPSTMSVPMKYVTVESYEIASHETAVFQADIDCDNLIESVVDVCAELPANWEWDPFKGYVYINIYNDTKDIDDVRGNLVLIYL